MRVEPVVLVGAPREMKVNAMARLEGRIAVITGASGGLGKYISRAYAGAGASVVLAARNAAKLEAVAEGIRDEGGAALAIPTDVTQEGDVVSLFQKAGDVHGRVDILVNNAGISSNMPTDEIPLDFWKQVIDTNITGAFLCSREALKRMKQQNDGRIINIGSIASKTPRPNSAPYTTTKHALKGLTASLARDGREFGITASIIILGATDTGDGFGASREAERADDQYRLEPADVADIAVMIAALPQMANVFDLTVLPANQPSFIARG
ncbi:MAG: hypothetical protein CMM10_12450 [Rhodospirillaceae bacterium]|nr:hypothetical protein [Rhodospirillaceae bacterium]